MKFRSGSIGNTPGPQILTISRFTAPGPPKSWIFKIGQASKIGSGSWILKIQINIPTMPQITNPMPQNINPMPNIINPISQNIITMPKIPNTYLTYQKYARKCPNIPSLLPAWPGLLVPSNIGARGLPARLILSLGAMG